jgi:hypothetical protein
MYYSLEKANSIGILIMPRRRIREHPALFRSDLPPFTSTFDEIRRAVQQGAIQKGELLMKVIISLRLDELIKTIEGIEYDREEIYERRDELKIDVAALKRLDNADPPIAYPLYFSTPDHLVRYPELVMYYRNVAMLSRKVMNGIALGTGSYEDMGQRPSQEDAAELSRHFNGIISKLVSIAGVTPNRHLEMALSNMGEALGGVARNEVGRYASAQIMHYLISEWHKLHYLDKIHYKLKGDFNLEQEAEEQENEEEGNEEANNQEEAGVPLALPVTSETDIESFLSRVEARRVKYQEVILKNGYQLLLDRQFKWQRPGATNKIRIGVDMTSKSVMVDMVWAAEVKGGADPAGSDEHWKTATKALDRVLDAAEETGRPRPKLSFIATILVDRVAIDAQKWIDEGKLVSVYNLTKIAENEIELRRFLNDMTEFLGYENLSKPEPQ